MVMTTLYTIISVIVVSLVSFVGIITLFFRKKKIDRLLLILVSISAGTLFGGAFFHLIPEAVEESGSFSVSISFLILAGITIFFLLDKLIHWRHSHTESSLIHTTKENKPSVAYLNLLGDGFHNFLDGLIIAGSYLVSIPTGIATTIAVVIHETPQEIADFGVLMYSGLSKWKALLFNFFSATLAIVGAIVGLILGTQSEIFIAAIVPFAGGAFVYIAGSNLIPELLRKNHGLKILLQQFLAFIVGIIIMYGLLFLE
jgi:zinc and cadmium transporter|tara:strand:+ start:163 stop:933 length:771 start_codon:yes stop_codon:yes gene_type:complete